MMGTHLSSLVVGNDKCLDLLSDLTYGSPALILIQNLYFFRLLLNN